MKQPVWRIAKDTDGPWGLGYFVSREDDKWTSLAYTLTLWGARRVMNRDRRLYSAMRGRDHAGRPYVDVQGPLRNAQVGAMEPAKASSASEAQES